MPYVFNFVFLEFYFCTGISYFCTLSFYLHIATLLDSNYKFNKTVFLVAIKAQCKRKNLLGLTTKRASEVGQDKSIMNNDVLSPAV